MSHALKERGTAAHASQEFGAQLPDARALRFLTAGSVDDGKSTLIGRLLLDSQSILSDQLESLVQRASGQPVDLSLFTDGLEAEREQGITIDVAYRYFATPLRKFIIADAPGHEQYTRNMVTAAAGSDAVVVLVDITKLDLSAAGVTLLPQTRRHTLLAHLLRVPNVIFAVNKMDAVNDPARAFSKVSVALEAFAASAGIAHVGIVPVSALRGDNVARRLRTYWYDGPTLLERLEDLPAAQEESSATLLLPVQYVATHGESTGHQARTLWGRIASGRVHPGDAIEILPSGERAVVRELRRAGRAVNECTAGESAGIVLDRQLDVSRGDWLATPGSASVSQHFEAKLAWLDTEPAVLGRKYLVRHGNRWIHARLTSILHRVDVHTLEPMEAEELRVNEVGQVRVELQTSLPLLPYAQNRVAGALIVVDPATHRTSGALLVS